MSAGDGKGQVMTAQLYVPEPPARPGDKADCSGLHISAAGIDVKVGTFPFAVNRFSLTQSDDSGFVRVVARSDDHVIVGIQAVGAHVSELASAFTLAIEMGTRAEDIAATIHAHPTRSEAIQEAALGVLGYAIHL